MRVHKSGMALAPLALLALVGSSTAAAAHKQFPRPTPVVAGSAVSPRSVLYVWAGDEGTVVALPVAGQNQYNLPNHADFLAVVDADQASPTYGKVLRTVSVPTPPVLGNEPHHVQPFVPPNCSTLVANGLLSDSWFTFDLSRPLHPVLQATINGVQTLGTVPQYAFVLPNCQVIGAEMGSSLYGAHGTLVRFDAGGARVLEERSGDRVPTDSVCGSQWNLVLSLTKLGGPFTRKSNSGDCLPSNPSGVSGRADLNTLVTSDYGEPVRLILPLPPTSDVTRLTVRHYPLDQACTQRSTPPTATRCIGDPRVVVLPDGPRRELNEGHEENVAVENVVATSGPGPLNPTGKTPTGYLPSRGAFATTTCGGALYYSADIAHAQPVWREVFDFSAANEVLRPGSRVPASCVGGGGLLVSPDNRFLVASIIGREAGQTSTPIGTTTDTRAFPGMIVMLDIAKLIQAGTASGCAVDMASEVWSGGAEADCPSVADVHVVDDRTSGGPHDLALDYPNGGSRLTYFDYFVSETGIVGDLRLCILRTDGGRLVPDTAFPAAVDGQRPGTGCISFGRSDWPSDRGPMAGPAKPHHGMFHHAAP